MKEPDFLDKARRICAQRETSKKELEEKLRRKGCPKEQIPEIIEQLEEEDALNEARFAESFVRDKLEGKDWGRLRIRMGLWEKGLDEERIEEALGWIDEKEEARALKRILAKKWREEMRKGSEKAREKTIAAAERKGHPLPRIMEIMEKASGPDSLDRVQPGGHEGRG